MTAETESHTLIQPVGPVDVWWVRRPPAPRLSVRAAGIASALVLAATAGAVYCVGRDEGPLWPWESDWGPAAAVGGPSAARLALRYLLVLGAGVAYAVVRSIPTWIRLTRLSREDLRRADRCLAFGQWDNAGYYLHRACLLWHDVWRRLPARARVLDRTIGKHLSDARRLYVYYAQTPPALPPEPLAGFAPRVVSMTLVGWWAMPLVLMILAAGYVEVSGALAAEQWSRLRSLNVLILLVLLGGCAYVYIMKSLGRRDYMRFAPGLAEVVSFGAFRRIPKVRTRRLRVGDLACDVTGPVVVLSIRPRDRREHFASYELTKSPEVVETCLRAALSTAEVRALPAEELVG